MGTNHGFVRQEMRALTRPDLLGISVRHGDG